MKKIFSPEEKREIKICFPFATLFLFFLLFPGEKRLSKK